LLPLYVDIKSFARYNFCIRNTKDLENNYEKISSSRKWQFLQSQPALPLDLFGRKAHTRGNKEGIYGQGLLHTAKKAKQKTSLLAPSSKDVCIL